MTAILDVAIRAGCIVDEGTASCGFPSERCKEFCFTFSGAIEAAFRAMFDAAERDPAALEAMANALWSDSRSTVLWDDIQEAEKVCWRDDAMRALRALKAHVLGEG